MVHKFPTKIICEQLQNFLSHKESLIAHKLVKISNYVIYGQLRDFLSQNSQIGQNS